MTPEDARRLVDLFEATCDGAGLANVFIIGSLCDRREMVAVAVQQVRAINLVDALVRSGRVHAGERIAVIGAGAAGLTAAAYAISRGVEVTVLENREPLWNLRGCRTRWLHPNLFARWPAARWNISATDLPVMNWYADYANNVGDLLWSKFQSYLRSSPQSCDLRINSFKLTPSNSKCRVHWTLRDNSDYAQDFKVAILAVGWGSEERYRDAAASVYWHDDVLEREDPHRTRMTYLVSGTGDGGLTDLLRIRLSDFRHHMLRELLLDVEATEESRLPQLVRDDELAATYRNNLTAAWERYQSELSIANQSADNDAHCRRATMELEINKWISQRFLDCAGRVQLSDLTLRHLRRSTTATITNRDGVALPLGSWRVSRFLAALLLVHDRENTKYRPSNQGGSHVVPASPPAEMEGLPSPAPRAFNAIFADSDADGHSEIQLDAVVYRHGTSSAIDRILADNHCSENVVKALRRKFAGVSTSKLLIDHFDDHDRERRRPGMVRSATAGRSIVGMLARLVQQLDPTACVAPPPTAAGAVHLDVPWPSDNLVPDNAAWLVAPLSDRIAPDRSSWFLSHELLSADVVWVIQQADAALECLMDPSERTRRHAQLEQHWVLPRPIWPPAPSGALLQNTCVARDHLGLNLRYRVRENASSSDLSSVRSSANPEELYIFDYPDCSTNCRRVAVAATLTAQVRRLAKELGCYVAVTTRDIDVI